MRNELLQELLTLLRHPTVKHESFTTFGDLADRLEEVYKLKHYRPPTRDFLNRPFRRVDK